MLIAMGYTNLSKYVVRNGSLIKWSTPLPLILMAIVKRHNMSGKRDGENIYKDDGSSTGEQTGDQQKVEHMRFKTTKKYRSV